MLATGALERPFVDSGLDAARRHELRRGADRAQGLWPGAGRRILIAGCGPLLWLIAWQYLNAGVSIAAILDTTPRANPAASC